ncbi:S-layer protein SlpA [Clostridioides difficile]|nr:S-layer protein SlpA [Clostridioides difficile]MCZ1113506.1 S-layer protein SlpA [Clostridioides difficile]MDI6393409.1 S-layer protein SlpA [Clostridioides difficile]
MNKKNVAIAMSALTVVGSAAPIFADAVPSESNANNYTVVKDKYKDIYDEIEKLVKENDQIISDYKKLDGNGSKSDDVIWSELVDEGAVNVIKMKVNEVAGDSNKDSDDIPKVPETTIRTGTVSDKKYVEDKLKNLDSDQYVDFSIQLKGTKGESTTKYTNAELTALANDSGKEILDGIKATTSEELTKNGVLSQAAFDAVTGKTEAATAEVLAGYFTVSSSLNKVTVTFAEPSSGKVLTTDPAQTAITSSGVQNKISAQTGYAKIDLTTESNRLDFSKPKFKGGKFEGFEEKAPVDGAVTPGKTYNVRVINAKQSNIKATDYDGIKAIVQKYDFDGAYIDKVYKEVDKLNKEDKLDGSLYDIDGTYKAVFYATGKRLQGFSSYGKNFTKDEPQGGIAVGDAVYKLVIESDDEEDFVDGIEDLKDLNNSYTDVISIAGNDRIETAIELSKTYYNSTDKDALYKNEVNNVVLVGSQAIVDGLVASPLAAEKEGPLLLTSKEKLDSSVKSEIKRVLGLSSTSSINSKKKVYLVGGENSISKDVEKAISDMGVKVERLSGDDRYSTSLKIADEVGIDNDKAFVVGGTGLADAMSIAPVASQLDSSKDATPIVVVDGKADKLSTDAADFLDGASKVDIIGGVNSVSDKVKDSIKDTIDKAPTRVSGDDRQDTNAQVINEYFKKENKTVKNFFLAKDGSTKEDQLVDALASAAVAGNFGSVNGNQDKVSPAPIVLATDNLSSKQHVEISKVVDDNASNKIVKVGGGIADSVVNKLKDLLGM